MEESLRDMMTSATSQSKNQEGINFGNLLNAIAKSASEASIKKSSGFPTPPPGILHSPPASLMSPKIQENPIALCPLIKAHTPVSNFKEMAERPIPSQLVAANEKYIAYVVGGKKVRVIDHADARKGIMENLKTSNGSIAAVGLKGDILASLTDSGELMISTLFRQSTTSLGCDPVVSLTFPDLKPSNSIVWSSGPEPVLAVHGIGPSVFIVWMNPKPLAVELPHSIPDCVSSVCFFGNGKYIAVANRQMVECFEISAEDKTRFTKVSEVYYGISVSRAQLFEDEGCFTIATSSNGNLHACQVQLGQPLSWIESFVPWTDKAALLYDPMMQAFVLDTRDGHFTVLGLKSDDSGFVAYSGSWAHPQTVFSMCLCPQLREISRGIHVPLFVFQPQYVSMYGLTLPAPEPVVAKPTSVQPTAVIQPSLNGTSQRINEVELAEVVKNVVVQKLVPSIEAAVSEMLSQIKSHVLNNQMTMESKIDRLSDTIVELKSVIESLSSNQVTSSLASGETPLVAPVTSMDDLLKVEIEEILEKDSPVAALVRSLEVGNLTVLSWLLSKLDLVAIVEVLPEPVKLSLSQQLGVDLATSTELKIDWLAEIFTTFKADEFEPSLLNEVVEELFSNLRVLFAQLPGDSQLVRKVKMVMRLVRAYI